MAGTDGAWPSSVALLLGRQGFLLGLSAGAAPPGSCLCCVPGRRFWGVAGASAVLGVLSCQGCAHFEEPANPLGAAVIAWQSLPPCCTNDDIRYQQSLLLAACSSLMLHVAQSPFKATRWRACMPCSRCEMLRCKCSGESASSLASLMLHEVASVSAGQRRCPALMAPCKAFPWKWASPPQLLPGSLTLSQCFIRCFASGLGSSILQLSYLGHLEVLGMPGGILFSSTG